MGRHKNILSTVLSKSKVFHLQNSTTNASNLVIYCRTFGGELCVTSKYNGESMTRCSDPGFCVKEAWRIYVVDFSDSPIQFLSIDENNDYEFSFES